RAPAAPAGSGGARRALDERPLRAAEREGHRALARQGRRVPGPGLDLLQRRALPRRRMARGHSPLPGPSRDGRLVPERGVALNALDRLTVVFAVLSSLAVLLRWPAGRGLPAGLLVGGAALVVVALCAPRLRARSGAFLRFVGDFYALFLTVGIYTGIGMLNRAAGVSH